MFKLLCVSVREVISLTVAVIIFTNNFCHICPDHCKTPSRSFFAFERFKKIDKDTGEGKKSKEKHRRGMSGGAIRRKKMMFGP